MATITIMINVDVVGALAGETLTGNLYAIDNNRVGGSRNEGTGMLQTRVNKGDVLLWNVMAIEPEAFSAATKIDIDKDFCQVTRRVYEGSDVTFWEGLVLKDLSHIPYTVTLALGTRKEEMVSTEGFGLTGVGQ